MIHLELGVGKYDPKNDEFEEIDSYDLEFEDSDSISDLLDGEGECINYAVLRLSTKLGDAEWELVNFKKVQTRKKNGEKIVRWVMVEY